MARARKLNHATFTPIADEPATFNLVSDEATFELVTPETEARDAAREELDVQALLERQGIASAEAAFLSGERKELLSSNVSWAQYFFLYPDNSPQHQLYIGFKDSSVYEYSDINLEEAQSFYQAASYGKWVWQNLRTLGDKWGYQKPYRLVSGDRIWFNAGSNSIARHESIPPEGAGNSYHPAYAWAGAPGQMGNSKAGVNLSKRGGSRKVAFFTAPGLSGATPQKGPFK